MIIDRISYTPRRRKCLGSKHAEAKAIAMNPALADDETKYSVTGDKLHAMLHKNDFAGADKADMTTLTDLIRMAADVEMDIMGECERPLKVYKEVTLWIDLPNGDRVEGHPDKVLVGRHKDHGWFALILDFKTGFIEVDSAEENDQLRGYAVALPSIVDVPISKTFARIIQRFSAHDTTVYGPEELALARADILAVYAASDALDAPRTPSASACRYCKAVGTAACPETARMVEHAGHNINPASLTPEGIANRLEMFALAEAIIDKERKTYKQMIIDNPNLIPGWCITPGDMMRSIDDIAGAHAALHGIIGDKFQSALKVSVPELQEAVVEAMGIPKAKGKEKIKELLGSLLIEKQKAGSLTQVSKKALKGKS